MKKTTITLIFILSMLMTVALASGTALASDYDHCAEALQAMGLFKGSTNGFELDRQATRAEAAVMLVRLLGAEEKAQNGEYSHPFTDVPEWASPHIAYMYETGLTKGVSASTFNPQGICDLQMYSTFILRALGYEESAGDYTYAAATDFAIKLGVVDLFTGSDTFLRDNMTAISYTALFATPKGTQTSLLAQLIEQGAVKTAAAQPYLTLFADYGKLRSVSDLTDFQLDIPLEIKFNLGMNMDMGAEDKVDLKYDTLLQVDASAVEAVNSLEDVLAALNKIKFGMLNQIALAGISEGEKLDMNFKLDVYLLDGKFYLNTDLGKNLDMPIPEKMKLDISALEDMLGEMDIDIEDLVVIEGLPTQDMINNITNLLPTNPDAPYYLIAQIKAIKSIDTTDGGKRIDISHIGFSNDIIKYISNLIYSSMPEAKAALDMLEFAFENLQYSYFLDNNDTLTGLKVDMSLNETVFVGTEDEATIKTTMQLECHITKTGADVSITLPDKAEDYMDALELLKALEGGLL